MLRSAFRRSLKNKTPDVLIIGGGPGGYTAAIRAAQLGLKTVVVEKEKLMGGTCLREGCIPSKFLLNASHKIYDAKNNFDGLGVSVNEIKIDMEKMMNRKQSIIRGLSGGIEALIKNNKGERVHGKAFINSVDEVKITDVNGKVEIARPKNIILAVGGAPFVPDFAKVDEEVVCTSRGALDWKTIPKSLTVVGGGVIGVEMASVWKNLGSDVKIIDMAKSLGGNALDVDCAKFLADSFRRKGIGVSLGKTIKSITREIDGVKIDVDGETMTSERVLIAVGRRSCLDGFGLEQFNLKQIRPGIIDVDNRFQTSTPRIYAIGDIIDGPQLAHKAEEEGIACVEIIAGIKPHFAKKPIPSVIYTHPEISTAGYTLDAALKEGIKAKAGKFPLSANSRARAMMETDGFVKLVTDDKDKLIGMQMVGSSAGELIMEGTIAISQGLGVSAIVNSCHPHPTVSEAIIEAAKLSLTGQTIHI